MLARLFTILQDKNQQEDSLVDFLKPDTFGLLISSKKYLGGFLYQTTEGKESVSQSRPYP